LFCVPVCGGWLVFVTARVQQHEPHGFLTAMFGGAMSMAAMFALSWRRERGLWMLYAPGGLPLLWIFLFSVLGVTRDLLRDPARFWPQGLDMALALLPAAASARLLLTAAVWNWMRFHPRSDGAAPSPPPPPEPLPVPAGLLPRPPSLSAAARPPILEVARSR
jgi:hypothetical protein